MCRHSKTGDQAKRGALLQCPRPGIVSSHELELLRLGMAKGRTREAF
jgi:hypothetical protein